MGRQRRSGSVVKWLNHYSSAQSILVVGDGDLSFSLALAAAFGSGQNLVATSLDSYDALTSMYGKAQSNVTKLERLGATVFHSVDAKMMKRHPCLKMRRFDRIVFNFPHAGFIGPEQQDNMIKAHQLLVRRFFRNASHLLRPDGEIHLSHKTGQPYDRWQIEELAHEFSLVISEMVTFRKQDYPGYNQKRGDGQWCDQGFPLRNACTFKFRFKREEAEEPCSRKFTAVQRESGTAPCAAASDLVKKASQRNTEKYLVRARRNERRKYDIGVHGTNQADELASSFIRCGKEATNILIGDIPVQLIAPQKFKPTFKTPCLQPSIGDGFMERRAPLCKKNHTWRTEKAWIRRSN
ncbi:uncharacterized protein At4g26485 [Lolium perenne]|uniref:uncharacterized protein At4g26485 n=1 Tax=Lolium perenne TaxID=4522 RepID=UPI0021F62E58|nr:heavy metal-associated isoprenylated plant protein 41-like isoform X1 [Lolium perenne]